MTDRPATRATGVTHATRASPSTSTVQQPHWPWGAQPSFTDTMPSRSRSTESSDSPAPASTATCAPLHSNATRSDTHTSARQDTRVQSMSRRSFLAATGTLLVAAACSSGGGSDAKAGRSDDPKALTAGKVSIEPYVSTTPQRLAYVVFRNNGDFAAGPAMQVALQGPGESSFGAPVDAKLHTEGLPAKRGVYVIDTPLPGSGVWKSKLTIAGRELAVPFEVTATPLVVTPGAAARRAASPTTADALGVSPICTQDPPCPLHTTSLDTVIGSGKPVAVMFATPARCQTMYCGPVLTELLGVMAPYRDRVEIVHVEIYKDQTSDVWVPTVDAWALPGEPWLFGIDGAGNVVGRLDGAFGTDEVQGLLGRLIADRLIA